MIFGGGLEPHILVASFGLPETISNKDTVEIEVEDQP